MTTSTAIKIKHPRTVVRHHRLVRKQSPIPYEYEPGIKVMEDDHIVNVDIKIPGVTKDRVEVIGHKPCIKRSSRDRVSGEELIRIVFPKLA